MWTGKPPNFGKFRIFGAPAYVYNEKLRRDGKFNYDKSEQGIFVGYELNHKGGYKVCAPGGGAITQVKSDEVRFPHL